MCLHGDKLLHVVEILEVVPALLALCVLLSILKQQLGGLLHKHDIDTLKCWEWGNVLPDAHDT